MLSATQELARDGAGCRVLQRGEGKVVKLEGHWDLDGIANLPRLRRRLKPLGGDPTLAWQLRDLAALDSIGALLLWRAWGERWPAQLEATEQQRRLLGAWENIEPRLAAMEPPASPHQPLTSLRRFAWAYGKNLLHGVEMLGQLGLDLAHLLRHPTRIPWREISAEIHASGNRALKITAMVGLLIGVVVSYLSAIQLRMFGAQQYIVDLLGLSVVRELGPMLAALLVAGRSGSAITAKLGVMRVTQELDALDALGISVSQRVVLPKVLALVTVMPLLILWTDLMALFGGAAAAYQALGLGVDRFLVRLPDVVPVINLYLGLAKGVVFGGLIALTACFYGLRIEPNTESLSHETTNAVVIAITQVILADAVFAVIFQGVGFS